MRTFIIISDVVIYQIKRTCCIVTVNWSFRLELRQNVDYSILRITMAMIRISAKMGVDHRNATNDMGMEEQADT